MITNNSKVQFIKKTKKNGKPTYFGFAVFNHMTFIKNAIVPLNLAAKAHTCTHSDNLSPSYKLKRHSKYNC